MLRRLCNTLILLCRCVAGKDPEKHREYRFILAGTVAHRLGGFRIYKHSHTWPCHSEYLEMWRNFPEGGSKIKDKQFSLYQLAKSIETLPGDTAECGVWRGASSFIICKATQGQGRHHHVFDSFEGLSEPTDLDKPVDSCAHVYTKGEFKVNLDVPSKNLSEFDFVRFYEGWIPERFKDVTDKRFALVHIDVDLYEPTLKSLDFFYSRTVSNGLIVCDDYGFVDCPGAKLAFDEFVADKAERHVVHLPSGQGFIVKR